MRPRTEQRTLFGGEEPEKLRRRPETPAADRAVEVLRDARRRLLRIARDADVGSDARMAIEEAADEAIGLAAAIRLSRPCLLPRFAKAVKKATQKRQRDGVKVGPDGLARVVQGGT